MRRRYRTRLIHRCRQPADPHAALVAPLYQTANFAQPSATSPGPYDYTRSGNPTRTGVEQLVAELHEASAALAFSSGMAAIGTLLRCLEPGSRVLVGHDVYGGTYRLLAAMARSGRLLVEWVDTTDVAAVRGALQRPASLLLLESPGNPLLRISDLRAMASLARDAGALLAVDNSTMSPHLQLPLALGADVVIESATKFLSGHGDLMAGILAVADREVRDRLGWLQNAEGTGLSPFDSWLLLRSVKTLAVRVEAQQESARSVARWLADDPRVTRVHYPGLARHAGADLHAAQARGPGAVLSLELAEPERAPTFVDACRLLQIAVSFGGVTSLISLPVHMSHAPVPAAARRRRSLPEGLVRISVGLEDPADLIEDLDRALTISHTDASASARA